MKHLFLVFLFQLILLVVLCLELLLSLWLFCLHGCFFAVCLSLSFWCLSSIVSDPCLAVHSYLRVRHSRIQCTLLSVWRTCLHGRVLFGEPMYFIGRHLIVNGERCVQIFSLRLFPISRKASFNFIHERNSLAAGFWGSRMGSGGSHDSCAAFFSISCFTLPFLFLLRIKLQTLIWGWLGCASYPLWRCCPAPCDGGGHGRSVWCRYSCQPIPCFSFWSLSTPPWYLVSWHYSLGSKLASFLEASPAGALGCGFFYCAESHSTLLHCAELLLFHSIEYSCLLSSTLLFSLPMWVHTLLNFKKSRLSFHWQFNWFFKRLSSSEVKSKLP